MATQEQIEEWREENKDTLLIVALKFAFGEAPDNIFDEELTDEELDAALDVVFSRTSSILDNPRMDEVIARFVDEHPELDNAIGEGIDATAPTDDDCGWEGSNDGEEVL